MLMELRFTLAISSRWVVSLRFADVSGLRIWVVLRTTMRCTHVATAAAAGMLSSTDIPY